MRRRFWSEANLLCSLFLQSSFLLDFYIFFRLLFRFPSKKFTDGSFSCFIHYQRILLIFTLVEFKFLQPNYELGNIRFGCCQQFLLITNAIYLLTQSDLHLISITSISISKPDSLEICVLGILVTYNFPNNV